MPPVRFILSITLIAFSLALTFSMPAVAATAQAPAPATAPLRAISTVGLKALPEAVAVSLTGLQLGAQVGRTELQAGADHLLRTGLFTSVNYDFDTRVDGVKVTYRLEEAPRLPVYFDNFPWVADSELSDAIRNKLPFYDGQLPSAGALVDQASEAVSALLATHDVKGSLELQPIANPLGEGDVLQFHLQGPSLQIASITFSDPALTSSKIMQQHLGEIQGKEYSRATIDVFLAEQVRPFYLQQGFLRVKLGPPEIRLTGTPGPKLPDRLPVFVPIATGPAYKWKGVQWHGNSALSEPALESLLGEKPGRTANGTELEAGWDRIREQYGQKGHLEVKLATIPTYDDAAHSISYDVTIEEGPAYRFGKLVLSGLSLEGEKRLQQSWIIAPGAVFDKSIFEELLTKLQTHRAQIFGDLPLHYDGVGHWLQTDPKQGTVDVLLDFQH